LKSKGAFCDVRTKPYHLDTLLSSLLRTYSPRKAENPINEINEGRNANDLMNRYGLAY